MSIQDSYEWAKKQREMWDRAASQDKDLSALNVEITKGGDHTILPVQYARAERRSFLGEVGKVEGDLIFHFYPISGSKGFDAQFSDKLGDAFVEVFKFEEKLFWDFVPEFSSWAVRVTGEASNPMSDRLAAELFDTLDELVG